MVQILKTILLCLLLTTLGYAQLGPVSGGTGTSTIPTSAQVLVGNGSGGYTPQTMSGACTMDSSFVMTCSAFVTGSGTYRYGARWTGTNTLGNSSLEDDGAGHLAIDVTP